MTLPTIIGFAGVVIVLSAYGLLASGRMSNSDWRYPVINIVGTLGIIVSILKSGACRAWCRSWCGSPFRSLASCASPN